MNKYLKKLEFDKILNKLGDYTITDKAKEKALHLELIGDCGLCNQKIQETAEGRLLIETIGMPPLGTTKSVTAALEQAEIGDMILPEQLEEIGYFLSACRRMKLYLKRSEYLETRISYMGRGIYDCGELEETISNMIRGGQVDDYATSQLERLVKNLEKKKDGVKRKLDQIMSGKKKYFTDAFVVQRDGHYVLPVKKEYKSQVEGTVYDMSSSGNTVFIEPRAVSQMQDEISILEIEKDNEIRKILYQLTDEVWQNKTELQINADMMVDLDFVFAKAKLGIEMNASEIPVKDTGEIVIRNGRHPLLPTEECVPLNLQIGGDVSGIIITGPNTGGKTVALKTTGLLQAMASSGLMIPAEEGSSIAFRINILCDIGDDQNISESLSTFSSHMKNIIQILSETKGRSLVLLDEVGSGTDPAEGMGIAISILEALRQKRCLFVATTHYPEVKDYAAKTEGLVNARMTFDKESLRPLYKLVIGEAGESCALYIAKKLGFDEKLIEIARTCAYGDEIYIGKELTERKPEKSEKKDMKKDNKKQPEFQIGDSVMVPPDNEKGIVCAEVDDMGNVQVQVKKVKKWYPAKRVKLLVRAAELYPEDYDFSVVFESVKNRKANRILSKRYDPEVEIVREKSE